jgi:hypothetical protein
MNRRTIASVSPIFVGVLALVAVVLVLANDSAERIEKQRASLAPPTGEEEPDFYLRITPHDPFEPTSFDMPREFNSFCDRVVREAREVRESHPWAGEYDDRVLGHLCLAPSAGFQWTGGQMWGSRELEAEGSVCVTERGLELEPMRASERFQRIAHLVPIQYGDAAYLAPVDRIQECVEQLRVEARGGACEDRGLFRQLGNRVPDAVTRSTSRRGFARAWSRISSRTSPRSSRSARRASTSTAGARAESGSVCVSTMWSMIEGRGPPRSSRARTTPLSPRWMGAFRKWAPRCARCSRCHEGRLA